MKAKTINPIAGVMRRLTGIIAGLILLLLQAQTTLAYGYGWDIPSFTGDIKVQIDGSIMVKETIVADYTNEEHHGIYRTIPVQYRDTLGNRLSLKIDVVSITDETGKSWNYTKSYEGDNIYIKIGDADVLLNKPSTFALTYKVERAITFFEDHDEIYWNLTGNEWDVNMEKVHATVSLPEGTQEKDIKATCYTGYYGSSAQNCKNTISGQTVTFDVVPAVEGTPALPPGQGLTVVVGFPKEIVAEPTAMQKTLWFLMENWGYLLPFMAFAYLFNTWLKRGRDPKISRTTIMPIYTPPNNLTPTEIGTIIDESVDVRDISSAIIDLAVRGYIKINEKKDKVLFFNTTEYELMKTKEYQGDTTLKNFEKKLLNAIFNGGSSTKISDLKNKFYKDLPDIKTSVYSGLVKERYFPASPENIRTGYYTLGGILLGVSIFFFALIALFLSTSAAVGMGLTGILFLIFAKRMPAKTKKGVEAYYQIKGLEEYIGTAEKDRIQFQEKENIFEKLLPYAMTLGIAEKWTKAFSGIIKNPPSWYTSNDPDYLNHFNTMLLYSRLNTVSSTMKTSFTSSPRSASGGGSGFSGGFSGGGFGGGGGGSW